MKYVWWVVWAIDIFILICFLLMMFAPYSVQNFMVNAIYSVLQKVDE